jgi:hypothetical protein
LHYISASVDDIIDNQAMTYMLQVYKNKKRDKAVVGWITKLNEYDFTISHLLGIDNVLSDLLSRKQTVVN